MLRLVADQSTLAVEQAGSPIRLPPHTITKHQSLKHQSLKHQTTNY